MNMTHQNMGSINATITSELKDNHLRWLVFMALALWFGLVSVLGIRGAFIGRPGSPPLPIFFGFGIPLLTFFAAYLGWGAFRAFILGADLRLVTAIQGWRWAGVGFLSLYAHGVLPGLFAFPAGLGDMAIGITAPWIVLGLIRHPSFVTSRRFVIWNVLGIIDLIVAVSLGAISSGFLSGITANITSSAMAKILITINALCTDPPARTPRQLMSVSRNRVTTAIGQSALCIPVSSINTGRR